MPEEAADKETRTKVVDGVSRNSKVLRHLLLHAEGELLHVRSGGVIIHHVDAYAKHRRRAHKWVGQRGRTGIEYRAR